MPLKLYCNFYGKTCGIDVNDLTNKHITSEITLKK